MKLDLIHWVDSFGCSPAWQPINDIQKFDPMKIKSVGWVVYEDIDHVVLVPHISPDRQDLGAEAQGCGDMTIPKSAVVYRKTLEEDADEGQTEDA